MAESSSSGSRADDADTIKESPGYSSSSLVVRSNWFVLLTRRRRKSSSTQSSSAGHSRDETLEDGRPGSSSDGVKELKIVKAFNRLLRIRSKKSQTSATTDDDGVSSLASLQPNDDTLPTTTASINHVAFSLPESPPQLHGSLATSSVASALRTNAEPLAATSTNMYCTSVPDAADDTLRTVLANQSTAAWLNSLSASEATVYRARIAMNPMGWYRGAMTRERAQQKLQAQPNGSFLVRDSQTAGCHFTLSFRSAGITLHYRIECANGFWVIESYRNVSLVGLIEHAQQLSRDQILCYVKPSSQLQQPFPVRLTHAISKRREVPSLQHVCRFVIRRHLVLADDDGVVGGKLDGCLPAKLQEFVRHKPFLGQHIGYFET